jgi:hypothetical protein
MTAHSTTERLTADEFYWLPDPHEGGKMELVRGEVVTYMSLASIFDDSNRISRTGANPLARRAATLRVR